MKNSRFFLAFVNFFQIIFSVILLFSLLSYHFDDPSFSVATDKKVENIFGNFGSYLSDIFVQFFGFFSYFIVLILVANPILFCLGKRYRLKNKFLFFSLICFSGVISNFLNKDIGVIGFLMSENWFFVPKTLLLIINLFFSVLFFSIFIRINTYQIKNTLNQKKMKKKNIKSENFFIKSTFESIKDFFLACCKKIIFMFRKKYAIDIFDDNLVYANRSSESEMSSLDSGKKDSEDSVVENSSCNINQVNRKRVIYNPGVRHDRNYGLSNDNIDKNNAQLFSEKSCSLSKGEVEYKKEGEEIRKSSFTYNHNVLNKAPKIFENEKNQRLYEELQARRLREFEQKQNELRNMAVNNSGLDNDNENLDLYGESENDEEGLQETPLDGYTESWDRSRLATEPMVDCQNCLTTNHRFAYNFLRIPTGNSHTMAKAMLRGDSFNRSNDENRNDNYDNSRLNLYSEEVDYEDDFEDEDDDLSVENNENGEGKVDYYDRESLLSDLKNNYQKFQNGSQNKFNKEDKAIYGFEKKSFGQGNLNNNIPNNNIPSNNVLNNNISNNTKDSGLPAEISPPKIQNGNINLSNNLTQKDQNIRNHAHQNPNLEKKISLFMDKKDEALKSSKIINLPKKEYPPFKLPDMNFLSENNGKKIVVDHHQAQINSEQLIRVLEDFSVFGRILNYHIGPVITLYEFEPSPGTKSSRVIGLADDIARSLSAVSARISVISGKNVLGIELPNEKRELVLLKEIFESIEYKNNSYNLPIALGKNIAGEPVVVDLSKMPHLLVAGTTGSGKSVAINVMILSILYSLKPDECKFIMIDPKMLELSVYNGIPHLLTPVVTDPKKAVFVLKWVVKEMESRYRMMSYLGVRNVSGYNEKIEEALLEDEELEKVINIGFDKKTGQPITEKITIEKKKFPYIVVIVDEMADLMLVAGKEIEFYIQRLAQMARAAGIHIIMATQRPSVDVITGVIKANLPTRISFAVTSKIDSRTILGEQGAEQLLGLGDMLYMASGNKVVRIHGPFVSDSEVEKTVKYLQSFGPPSYLDEITSQINSADEEDEEGGDFNSEDLENDEDLCFQKAIDLIRKEKRVSISYIQRQLRIGYNRAASIVERMEAEGIVTPPNHQGKRELVE